MSTRNSNQQKYSDAGEQAGRVIGEFISIADNFSKRFEKEFSGRKHPRDERDSASDFRADRETPDMENDWRNAGEYLRELREAAGYTVDGFAKAMNRQGAARKIQSVEAGRDIFPEDWLDQMSALLKQNDPIEFFEKLRGLYDQQEPDAQERDGERRYDADSGDSVHVESVASSGVADQRRQQLLSIFSDEQLESLSDSEFEELLAFAETNLKAAVQLVRNK